MDFLLLQKIGVAVCLGALIGLEREQKYQRTGIEGFGGIRTFTLISLMGALSYFLATVSEVYFAVITAGFLLLITAAYVMSHRVRGHVGGTSEIAAILVYMVGVLSVMGEFVLATALALTILVVLHFKQGLHRLAKHLSNQELISAIAFIAVAFVVLPLLPNEDYGPYGFFNPKVVWLMVVLVSALSYASYVAVKIFGSRKGIGITGFLAGFVSSTALAMSFSQQSRDNKQVVMPYVLAMVVAGSAVFFRILLEVAAVNPGLLPMLYVPMLSMGFVGLSVVLYLWFFGDKKAEKKVGKVPELRSPFNFWPALKFGLFFALILFVTKLSSSLWGDRGVYFTSFVSGILDVDAITLSLANDSKVALSEVTAVKAITLAAMVNTLSKAGIFVLFGSRKVAIRIVLGFGIVALVGLASFAFL